MARCTNHDRIFRRKRYGSKSSPSRYSLPGLSREASLSRCDSRAMAHVANEIVGHLGKTADPVSMTSAANSPLIQSRLGWVYPNGTVR